MSSRGFTGKETIREPGFKEDPVLCSEVYLVQGFGVCDCSEPHTENQLDYL